MSPPTSVNVIELLVVNCPSVPAYTTPVAARLFDDILPNALNVIALTLSNPLILGAGLADAALRLPGIVKLPSMLSRNKLPLKFPAFPFSFMPTYNPLPLIYNVLRRVFTLPNVLAGSSESIQSNSGPPWIPMPPPDPYANNSG